MKHSLAHAGMAQQISAMEFFRGIDAVTIESIARHCRWRAFEPEQQVVVHGENNDDVYFIAHGKVRVTLFAPNGRQVIFQDLSRGEMFGELAALDAQPRSSFVTAITAGDCMTLKASIFRGLLQMNDALANRVLTQLSQRVRFLSERIYEFSSLRVKDRVRSELLRIALEHGDGDSAVIRPFPTHTDFANRISTHREAVTREINALIRRGVVSRDRYSVRIHDLHRLQSMIGQDSL